MSIKRKQVPVVGMERTTGRQQITGTDVKEFWRNVSEGTLEDVVDDKNYDNLIVFSLLDDGEKGQQCAVGMHGVLAPSEVVSAASTFVGQMVKHLASMASNYDDDPEAAYKEALRIMMLGIRMQNNKFSLDKMKEAGLDLPKGATLSDDDDSFGSLISRIVQ